MKNGGKKNTKKIFAGMCVLTLVLVGFIASAKTVIVSTETMGKSSTDDDSYDVASYGLAQTFRNNLQSLSRVEIKLKRFGCAVTSFEKYYLAIKEGPFASQPLTLTYVMGTDIPGSAEWVEFDFPDIDV